ncbi:MAG TPA: BON domain-containing protein [Acidimicrobiales bacterium]
MGWITTTERTTYDWDDLPGPDLPSDREMKSALVHRLNENLYTQDAQIRVEVTNRVVLLHGDVASPIVKRVAAEDALDVPGVLDVSNQLTVAGR